MKRGVTDVFLAVLFLSLGIQAAIWNEEPKSFNDGETYQFNYSSQVLSGLPKSSAEYSGLKVNCIVELSFGSDSKVTMNLKNVEFLETTKSVRTRKPLSLINRKKFTKLNNIAKESQNKLLYPVTFKWNIQNKISDFKINSKDDTFSANIKRGIVNMLNLQLKMDDTDWKEEGGTYYSPDDEGIEGVCSAMYVWSSFPYLTAASKLDNVRSISLSRTKSGNKCRKPVGYHVANFLFSHTPSKEVDFNRTIIKVVNGASMNLTIWKSKKFFLWEAWTEAGYHLQPKNERKESMSTYAVQSFRFIKINKMAMKDSADATVSKSLQMDMTKIITPLKEADKKNIISLIEKLMDVKGNVISELIYLLRRANEKDMKDISSRMMAVIKKKPEIKKPYLELLSEVLTYESTKTLIDDYILVPTPLEDDDTLMASLIAPLAGLSTIENSKIIELLTTAASKEVLLNHKFRSNTLKSTWLTIGSLAGTHYLQQPKYDIASTIKLFTKIIKCIKCSLSKDEKSLIILKALGNIGTVEILPYLNKYLTDKTKPLAMRVQAVYSLRKVPRLDLKIEKTLLKLYMDVSVDVELRLAAAVDLVIRHKSLTTLYAVVLRLRIEPIKQVKSFVQDLIVGLSNLEKTKEKYKPLLQKMNIEFYSMDYSKSLTIPYDNIVMVFSWIFTPNSKTIRTANMIIYDFRFDKMLIPLEIGFRFNGEKVKQANFNEGYMALLTKFMKIPKSESKPYSDMLTMYVKRFDNEIGLWSVTDELFKKLNFKKMDDLINFMKGQKTINWDCNAKRMINGVLQIPTTVGVKYTAKIHSVIDLRWGMNFSTIHDAFSKTLNSKIETMRHWKNELIIASGIDASYFKSLIRLQLTMVTPKPITVSILSQNGTQVFRLRIKKPDGDVQLFEHFLEKKFKTIYYNKTGQFYGVSKLTDINPYYVAKKELRKMKTKIVPFLFGMKANYSYYCDVGKPRTDGLQMSLLSAGDAYTTMWLKTDKQSDFDEFEIGIKNDIFFDRVTKSLVLKHLQNGKAYFETDLIKFNIKRGIGQTIEVEWPENYKEIFGVLAINSVNAKQPKLKYVKLTGSITMPAKMQFNKKEPLQILRYKSKYSYGFTGTVRNSKGETLYNVTMKTKMDDSAKSLGKDISKNLAQYRTDNELLSQCYQDIELKQPNSPACFNAWCKLNYFNKVYVAINSTTDGAKRLKKIYNKLNVRVPLSKYLISEKLDDNDNSYSFSYILTPYFYPSTLIKTTYQSLERKYLRTKYQQLKIGKAIFKMINKNQQFPIDFQACQIRQTENKLISVKTFDNYYYNMKWPTSGKSTSVNKRIVIAQDDENNYQVSTIGSGNDVLIQVVTKGLSIRIVRNRNAVEVLVNNTKVNTRKLSSGNFPTFDRITNTIYGDLQMYELTFKDLRISTDLNEILDVQVSL